MFRNCIIALCPWNRLSCLPRGSSCQQNTWLSHDTFHLCVFLIGYCLPAGVQPVSLATSNACKHQWYSTTPFVHSKRSAGRVQASPHNWQKPLRGSNFSWRTGNNSYELLLWSHLCPVSLSLLFSKRSQHHCNKHKIWEIQVLFGINSHYRMLEDIKMRI